MMTFGNNELLYAMQRTKLDVGVMNIAHLDEKWSFPNLRASFTRVYIPIEGEAYIFARGERVTLEAGKIYVIPYGMSLSCSCPSSLQKLYFHFNLRDMFGNDIFDGMDSVIVLEDEGDTIRRVTELFEKKDAAAAVQMKAELYGIVGRVLERIPQKSRRLKDFSECTERAIAYIRDNVSAALTVQRIADALFVSKQVLQKHFKDDVGKPVGKYIDEKVMEKAESYLLGRKYSLSEISETLGFCDQFYFSRRFTETHGVSPLRFRKLHLASPENV